MITWVRFLGARKQLNEEIDFQLAKVADQAEVIARLEKHLTDEIERCTALNTALKLRAEVAEAEAARLREDSTYVAAARCECGGDAELHWRRRAVAAEAQAVRDRANARVLTDRLADAEGRQVSAGYVR